MESDEKDEKRFLETINQWAKSGMGLTKKVDENFSKYCMDRNLTGCDCVNNPPHYNKGNARCECGRQIECIDVTRHHSFNIGNAIKYLWRCDLKGQSIEDLRKAVWYIQDEIKERLKKES